MHDYYLRRNNTTAIISTAPAIDKSDRLNNGDNKLLFIHARTWRL